MPRHRLPSAPSRRPRLCMPGPGTGTRVSGTPLFSLSLLFPCNLSIIYWLWRGAAQAGGVCVYAMGVYMLSREGTSTVQAGMGWERRCGGGVGRTASGTSRSERGQPEAIVPCKEAKRRVCLCSTALSHARQQCTVLFHCIHVPVPCRRTASKQTAAREERQQH